MREEIALDRRTAEASGAALPSALRAIEPPAAPKRRGRDGGASIPRTNGRATPVIGYASWDGEGETRELRRQATAITRVCIDRGLRLTEVVGERPPATGKGLGRPGLGYALDQISSGEASGLVVAELSRITYSAAELGSIIEWLGGLNVRLIAAAPALDTSSEQGRFTAGVLIEVSRWERTRLSERTRNGLKAARQSGKTSGRGAVADHPALRERITQMRTEGMTLQAIADQLNQEGVPTVRGGAKWRHSSVQAAAGYRRSHRRISGAALVQRAAAGEQVLG